jgi:DnaJ-class molecular chaperone
MMASRIEYYSILQVHPRAEKEIIDVAYRRLAAKYHPDVSQVSNAEERMKQINIAYEVLSDPVKRAAYDAARGAAPSMDTPPDAVKRSRYRISARRALLIAAGIALLAVLAVS